MSPLFICFNGPVEDERTLATSALADYGYEYETFYGPVYATLHAITDWSSVEWLQSHPHDPITGFGSRTVREHLYALSERWFRPQYGDDILGRLLADRCSDISPVAVADCEDPRDLDPLIDLLGARVHVVRLTPPDVVLDGAYNWIRARQTRATVHDLTVAENRHQFCRDVLDLAEYIEGLDK